MKKCSDARQKKRPNSPKKRAAVKTEGERKSLTSTRILIVGLSAAGAAGLPARLLERIAKADLLVGGKRHLGYFSDFRGERLTIGADVEAVARRLQQAVTDCEQAVILASGDPLCYGIGATLRRFFPAESLEIIPSATAFQLAFAALAEPWSEAMLLSAHARPLEDVVGRLVELDIGSQQVQKSRLERTKPSDYEPGWGKSQRRTLTAPKAAILTDNQHTPAVVARALLEAGLSPDSACAICENLGSSDQRIVRTRLGDVQREEYAPLNVFVVWRDEPIKEQFPVSEVTHLNEVTHPHHPNRGGAPKRNDTTLPALPPGLSDNAFSTSAAQITKREMRLLSLAELALGPNEVMWDIGAGSGSVGIEAARTQPTATVYAIEKRPEMCEHVRENLRRFAAPNLYLTAGVAPDDTVGWPDPNAVFIGGSGGRLEAIVEMARQRLQPGGRLVINLATLENLHTARTLLPEASVAQVQINRGVPILNLLRFEALNPVFIVTWKK
jgi:precorrin-6Y C5,15-methyltransferase (decarboxylating)